MRVSAKPKAASLFHMHNQAHGRMDVTADLEGAGAREGFVKNFAGPLLLGIEHAVDIDLMDETVLIGEGEVFASGNGHFARAKGAALLGDHTITFRGRGRSRQKQQEQEKLSHGASPGHQTSF